MANENKTVSDVVKEMRDLCSKFRDVIVARSFIATWANEVDVANKRDLAELRSLVKELSDAIDKVLPENADCCHVESTLCKDGCMPNGKCNIDIIRAIAVKARKVLGDEK